jgi:kynurenine formamidase/dienelactone hydrolase
MAPIIVSDPFRPHLHRLLQFGIAPADLFAAAAAACDWDGWRTRMEAIGDAHRARLDEALRAGRLSTAAELGPQTAAYYHFAQFKTLPGPDGAVRRLRQATRDSFAAAAHLLSPPAERVEIPYGGSSLVGYLRLAAERAPCVVLINGLDSCKEVELHRFSEVFLRRGLSTLALDGPGQGECQTRWPLLPGFEVAISAVIDYLAATLRPSAVGLFGVSFGGHLAPRAAAAERRVAACLSLGGFFDASTLAALPPVAWAALRAACHLRSENPLESLADRVDLEPLRGQMDRPLFVVHGGADHLVRQDEARKIADWASGPTRFWSLPDSEHVCADRFAECLPVFGDWMREALAYAAPIPGDNGRTTGASGGGRPILIDLSRVLEPNDGERLPITIRRFDHLAGAAHMAEIFGLPAGSLPEGLGWAGEEIDLSTHCGTHMDAPWHYGPRCGGAPARTIDQIPLDWCLGPGIKLDLRHLGDGVEVGVDKLAAAVADLPADFTQGTIMLIQTGADRFWGHPEYPARGAGLGRDAVHWLVERGVRVIGTDAWGLDRSFDAMIADYRRTGDVRAIWPAHFAGRDHEYCQLEKLTNLDRLPATGFKVACFPIAVRDGSAGWVRVVAMMGPGNGSVWPLPSLPTNRSTP